MKDLIINVIVAIGANGEIGKDNKLIWKIPEDLKMFKALTENNIIIMGRKTFDSLPFILPNRKHIVISKSYISSHSPEVSFYNSLDKALMDCRSNIGIKEVWVIGGESIFKQIENISDNLFLSRINDTDINADAFFNYDLNKWFLEDKEYIDSKPISFVLEKYIKKELKKNEKR